MEDLLTQLHEDAITASAVPLPGVYETVLTYRQVTLLNRLPANSGLVSDELAEAVVERRAVPYTEVSVLLDKAKFYSTYPPSIGCVEFAVLSRLTKLLVPGDTSLSRNTKYWDWQKTIWQAKLTGSKGVQWATLMRAWFQYGLPLDDITNLRDESKAQQYLKQAEKLAQGGAAVNREANSDDEEPLGAGGSGSDAEIPEMLTPPPATQGDRRKRHAEATNGETSKRPSSQA